MTAGEVTAYELRESLKRDWDRELDHWQYEVVILLFEDWRYIAAIRRDEEPFSEWLCARTYIHPTTAECVANVLGED